MKLTLLSAMLMTAVVGITSANAADYKKNPFTLLPFALYRQGYEYYWKTHAHPNIFRSVRDIVPSKRWLL
ncbi:TPA: hypothetical protein J1059_002491 [Escherichia coli]|nr:hypothetical protein [Escherichia coli]